jgi:hypothetical protein
MLRGSSRVSSPPKLALIPPAAKSHCDQWLPYAKESCLGHSYAPFLRAACMSWLSVWGYKDLVSLPRHGITLLHHPGSIAAQDSCDYLCQDCITAQLLPLLNPFSFTSSSYRSWKYSLLIFSLFQSLLLRTHLEEATKSGISESRL